MNGTESTSSLFTGGFVDAHAHFFPPRMFSAVWDFFETHNWRINYKGDPDFLADVLRGFGASHFTVLNYPHKPGVRDGLAEWTRDFAARQQGSIPFGSLLPGEPGNLEAAARWFGDWGFRGLKMQPLVSCRPINQPDMYPVFELMAERGKWFVVHAGTAPYPNEFTSLDDLEALLSDIPELKTILCHMGGFDFEKALAMMEKFPNLHLDTAMIFVDAKVFDSAFALPDERLLPFADRIVFGSDFPNIPYDFSEAVDGLKRRGFDDAFLRGVFRENSRRMFELD